MGHIIAIASVVAIDNIIFEAFDIGLDMTVAASNGMTPLMMLETLVQSHPNSPLIASIIKSRDRMKLYLSDNRLSTPPSYESDVDSEQDSE